MERSGEFKIGFPLSSSVTLISLGVALTHSGILSFITWSFWLQMLSSALCCHYKSYLTFSTFSFYCFFVDFTHVSQSHLSPHPLKSALCAWNLPPKTKKKIKKNQNPQIRSNQATTTKEKTFIMEAVVWPIDLHSLFTLTPFVFTCKCSVP